MEKTNFSPIAWLIQVFALSVSAHAYGTDAQTCHVLVMREKARLESAQAYGTDTQTCHVVQI